MLVRNSLPASQIPVIAIDGPTASGKGTVASYVAAALGFRYLESGALYRLVALASLEAGALASDEERVIEIAANLPADFRSGQIFLSGKDVTDAIRDEAVGTRASEIAPLGRVRSALLARQRAFRQPPGLVAEGRDMASVVFPDARLKVFLTASLEEIGRASCRERV